MSGATRVTLLIPAALREHAGGADALTVEATTVRCALDATRPRHAALAQHLLARDGALRPFVKIFVHSSDIRDLNGLDTTLRDGDTLVILPAIAGG